MVGLGGIGGLTVGLDGVDEQVVFVDSVLLL